MKDQWQLLQENGNKQRPKDSLDNPERKYQGKEMKKCSLQVKQYVQNPGSKTYNDMKDLCC